LIALFPCRHGRTTVIAPFPGLKGRAAQRPARQLKIRSRNR
jgi:hypothetical protein